MSNFKEIKPEEFTKSPFSLIGKEWMLVGAQKSDGTQNAMTASWGGLGVLWGKNVAYVVIRPQRFTRTFVEESETFSLSFFSEDMRKMLNYMGSVSGRQENKIEKAGLTVLEGESAPCFAQAQATILCKKLYAQDLDPDCFIAKELDAQWYPAKDYHRMYIAEIQKILVRE